MEFPGSISPTSTPPPEVQPAFPPPPEDPPWSLLEVIAIAAFAVVALIATVGSSLLIAQSVPHFRHLKPADVAQNVAVAVSAQAAAYVLVVAFMVVIVRMKGASPFLVSISWNTPHVGQAAQALVGGAALAILSSVFTALLSHWIPKSLPIGEMFRDRTSAYVLACFGVTVAPVVEELFFRGFLYPALARRMGVAPSVIFTAAFFAVVHQGQLAHAWVPLVWLFIVGVVLTVVRAKTKSVATCILLHVAYNTTLFSFIFIASHGFRQLDRI